MKLFVCVCALSSIILDFSAAAELQGKMSPEEHRMLRSTGDNGQTTNMAVAFVPLISIIANFLPRFFNRYGSVPSATVQHQARSFSVQHKHSFKCQMLGDIGMKWSDHSSSNHYYQCHSSKYCSRTNNIPCFAVRHHQCQLPKVFSFNKQQCLQNY